MLVAVPDTDVNPGPGLRYRGKIADQSRQSLDRRDQKGACLSSHSLDLCEPRWIKSPARDSNYPGQWCRLCHTYGSPSDVGVAVLSKVTTPHLVKPPQILRIRHRERLVK